MAQVTALSMIYRAMREIGALDVIGTPSAEETAVCLDALNDLIDTWSTQPQAAYNNHELTVSLPSGTASLTIGPGQQINVERPLRIEMAYARYFNIDRVITSIEDKAQWDAILIKDLGTSWPEVLWYDGGLPTGNVYFWPRPSGTVDLHITVLNYVGQYALATDSQELSRGYKRALELALAVEIAPQFNLPLPANLELRAAQALKLVKRANHNTPELEIGERRSARLGRFLAGL